MVQLPTSELLPEEISKIKNRLYDCPAVGGVSWSQRLLRVQSEIIRIIDTTLELKKHFKILNSRNDVKTFGSILGKINSYRRDGETSYDIDSLEDLIGAQMLCPYPEDVTEILNWLYDKRKGGKYFQLVTPRRKAEEERRDREIKTGYRAYHICLKLKKGVVPKLPSGSETDKFELQIKTLLEAAWDGKTHDVTYKAKGIEHDLLEHMQFISHSLTAIDEQTRLLRYQIKEEQCARDELRKGVTCLLFYVSLNHDQKKQLGIGDKPIDKWKQEDVNKLKNGVENYKGKKGIDITFCFGRGLLATYTADRYLQEETLSYASSLVKEAKDNEDLHRALRCRALFRWAFGHAEHSLHDLNYCLEQFKDDRTKDDKNDFVYYICDLQKPDDVDLNKAQQLLKELESGTEIPWYILDTIGRFYIRFAKDETDIDKGLEYLQQAENAKKTEDQMKVCKALKRYHEYLAIRQRARIRRGV